MRPPTGTTHERASSLLNIGWVAKGMEPEQAYEAGGHEAPSVSTGARAELCIHCRMRSN